MTDKAKLAVSFPTTPDGWCLYYRWLDSEYGTDRRSPTHHDNRCPHIVGDTGYVCLAEAGKG